MSKAIAQGVASSWHPLACEDGYFLHFYRSAKSTVKRGPDKARLRHEHPALQSLLYLWHAIALPHQVVYQLIGQQFVFSLAHLVHKRETTLNPAS